MKAKAKPLLALCLCVSVADPGCAGVERGEARRPNIVLILSDDQGMGDVGCYGGEIPTPNLDRLAREGLKLTSFYAASSICTPSRFGLLTGRNPSRSRDRLLGALMFLGEADARRGIREDETTLAELLRAGGYRTSIVGKWHLGHGDPAFLPTRHGFEAFFGHTGGCVDFFTLKYGNRPDWYRGETLVEAEGYATSVLTDEALRVLRAQSPRRPFFLYLPFNAPHFGKGWDGAKPVNVLQPHPDDVARVAHVADPARRAFAAKVVGLDDAVGRILDAVPENTIVIFMTDNGGDPVYGGSNRPFRGDKGTLFEGGIRVPCLLRWPGRIRAGTTSDAVVSGLDMVPTLCRLAGMGAPAGLDGRDVSSLLLDGTPPGECTLAWELGAQAELQRGAWRAVRRGDWKYVREPDGRESLFELRGDPGESRDLASQRPDVLLELRP